MAKKKNGEKTPQPMSVGKYVDRVLTLRSERESAVDKAKSDAERRFEKRERSLLDRVPEDKRMMAHAMLLAALEQRNQPKGSVDPEMHARVTADQAPPV